MVGVSAVDVAVVDVLVVGVCVVKLGLVTGPASEERAL